MNTPKSFKPYQATCFIGFLLLLNIDAASSIIIAFHHLQNNIFIIINLPFIILLHLLSIITTKMIIIILHLIFRRIKWYNNIFCMVRETFCLSTKSTKSTTSFDLHYYFKLSLWTCLHGSYYSRFFWPFRPIRIQPSRYFTIFHLSYTHWWFIWYQTCHHGSRW